MIKVNRLCSPICPVLGSVREMELLREAAYIVNATGKSNPVDELDVRNPSDRPGTKAWQALSCGEWLQAGVLIRLQCCTVF